MDIQNVKVKLLGTKENTKHNRLLNYRYRLHQKFEKMTTDEQKEEFDLSDHIHVC